MSNDINVLCIGESLVELFETKLADGKGAGRFNDGPIQINGFAGETIPNLANALKQTFLNHGTHLSATVDLFTAIGDDDASSNLKEWLRDDLSLGTDNIKIINNGKLATVTNFFDEAGQAVTFQPGVRFEQKGRETSAAREMFSHVREGDAGDDDLRALLKGHTHLVVSAVGLGCTRDRQKFIRLMDIAKNEMQIPVFFSTNLRPAVWKFDNNTDDAQWKAQAKEWIGKALPYVSTILASHSDEKTIFGDEDAEQTLLRLKSQNISEIVVTDGAKPIRLAYTQNHRPRQETIGITPKDIAPGADDSGAGDAFAGGYIASRIEEHDPILSAKIGSELGKQMLNWAGSFPPKGQNFTFTPPSELARELY